MKSDYLVDRATWHIIRGLYIQEIPDHPNCRISFGWGGDSTGRIGVNCGFYHDTRQSLPPTYLFDNIPICLAFPDKIPNEYKSGVLGFCDNEFKILPIENFKPEDLITGTLDVAG